jgi:hypothetical protein
MHVSRWDKTGSFFFSRAVIPKLELLPAAYAVMHDQTGNELSAPNLLLCSNSGVGVAVFSPAALLYPVRDTANFTLLINTTFPVWETYENSTVDAGSIIPWYYRVSFATVCVRAKKLYFAFVRELQIRQTINKNGFSAALVSFRPRENPYGMFHHGDTLILKITEGK